MTFPNTVEEFMEQYKITDTEQIYTNGAELVPIFRMKQWFDHNPEQRWIPCSEILPEESYVICCDNHGEILVANPFECDDSDTGFSAESETCYMHNCVAWMPRPKPYKGEES